MVAKTEVAGKPEVAKIPLSALAEQYAAILPMEAQLAILGKKAIDLVISTHAGKLAVVKAAREGVDEVTVEVSTANEAALTAAIASLPNFRAKFANTVFEIVKAYREGAEYGKMLEKLAQIQASLESHIAKMRESTNAAALPFDATLFIDPSVTETKMKSTASGVTPGNRRHRAPSETKWNLDTYSMPRLVEGIQYFLNNGRSNGGIWTVESESGEVVAEGTSANAATKEWFRSRGLSDSVSSPATWGAAEQEAAAEEV
jgi:hypothetical protein